MTLQGAHAVAEPPPATKRCDKMRCQDCNRLNDDIFAKDPDVLRPSRSPWSLMKFRWKTATTFGTQPALRTRTSSLGACRNTATMSSGFATSISD